MLVIAKGNVIKLSPRKLNLVAEAVRGKKASIATMYLRFCKKKAALHISKVLNSAIANAQYNYNFNIDNLYIKEILVNKSLTLRRIHAKAMGKANRIRKRYSSLIIKLKEGS